MNLLTIFSRFPDQEACIEYLEKVRWAGEPNCPHCGAENVARKSENTASAGGTATSAKPASMSFHRRFSRKLASPCKSGFSQLASS